jgi:anti-sigma-K factor RsiG
VVNQLFPRRIDRVLDPAYLADVDAESLDRLHEMLDECLQIETETAYVRQLALGRISILDAEQRRRATGGSVAELVAALPQILAGDEHLPDPLSSRLPRYLAPAAKIEFKRGLETYVSDESLATLPALPDTELAERLAKLHELEREASARRSALVSVIERLEAAIAARVTAGT